MVTIGGDAVMQGTVELIRRPGANTGVAVRRNVGGIKGAESRREGQAAAEGRLVRLRMATAAIPDNSKIVPPRNGIVRLGLRGQQPQKERQKMLHLLRNSIFGSDNGTLFKVPGCEGRYAQSRANPVRDSLC